MSPRRAVRRAKSAATSWVARQPLDVFAHRAVRAALMEHVVAMADVDAVVVHHQALAPMIRALPPGRARNVLHLFHAAGDRADQLAAFAPQALQRALLHRDGNNARAVERAAIEHADALVVTTEADAVRLGRPGTPTVVVPQGIDLERFAPSPLPAAPVVLFSGSLNYDPNVDGLLWFAATTWPLVRERVPDAELLVVGHSPVPAVRDLHGRDGISVHPDVPTMAPWLAKARVAVAPLRVGTGVRVKALEALAAGRPIVGTTIALEGIPVGPAEVAIEDDPTGFSGAVVALLVDDALASERAANGRAFVEAHSSWPRSAALLRGALLGDRDRC
jgi:glycosyltransferase involved in cell wall biosynthesis